MTPSDIHREVISDRNSENGSQPHWSEAKRAKIRESIAVGIPYSQIARNLKTTKDAICGQVFRMRRRGEL